MAPDSIQRVQGLPASKWRTITRALFRLGAIACAVGICVVITGFAVDSAPIRVIGVSTALVGTLLLYASWSPLLPHLRRISEEVGAGYTTLDQGFEWVPQVDPATGLIVREAQTTAAQNEHKPDSA